MSKIILSLCLFLGVNSIFAAPLTSNCTTESGVTTCHVQESNQDLMSLSCDRDKSLCTGKYFDSSVESVNLVCSADREAFYFKCSGGVGKDHFSLNCGPAEFEFGKFACSITDSSGASVKVMCDMLSGTGMPNCSGVDSQGVKHTVACTTNESGISSCSID